ncbi:hypothetical protein H6789_01295 [Candidatus Nomurabacteria bacterium]|nr:hypothetical protein [Candidatus Nomurabacteria bacterium]
MPNMEKKWNLQDIKPAERRRPARSSMQKVSEVEKTASENPAPRRVASDGPVKKRTNKKGLLAGILVLLVVAVAVFGFAAVTGQTTVTVFPRWREPTVNAVFEANPQLSESNLVYEVLTLEAEGEREVTATGQEEVEEQATGEITIYKTTSGQERLIKNTRFESPDGKIFRITESAVVPGGTSEEPGSVVAQVFADEAGPDYNLSANTQFKVPGFKESNLTELYDAIYAVNLTAFAGGHRGPKFTIDDAELQAATESLRTELREALLSRVANERPSGFILYDSSVTFDYSALPGEDIGNNKVLLKEKAILRAPMFKNEDFASFIASATIPGYENEPVKISDPSALTFEYSADTNFSGSETFSFKLLGRPQIIWTYDQEQLKRDLAGGSQTALNTVLGGYPAIEKANATIKPFWKSSFPENPEEIEIIEELTTE